ncbi:MAG: VCBS repeat-containing protein, partial [Planctomycetota bacterium]
MPLPLHSTNTMRHFTLLLALAAPASAQSVDWLEFSRDDSLLSAQSFVGLGDDEEKDYAWADFDRDGWIDLVCVRKQPFTTQGRRRNVLFMNESGVLVDRSQLYASDSDVPGDQGFLTSTNDRDVACGDLDGDGWIDFVTATTFSPGQSKEVSHPRVYLNLGEVGGVWQGFQYQAARIPDWGTYPNMCGVAIGDVTGDGAPDIYFSHYEQQAQVDLNDRLLINDGLGFFTDESSSRMNASMRGSSFGTSAVIDDMNGDGANDVISVSGSGQTGGLTRSSIAYNNPSNEGFFNILQEPYTGAPYHVATGDLNGDGLRDLIISDDSDDRYLINEGNDVFGRVEWGPARTFATDDGFGSNNYILDLDGDGLDEAIICDVDVDLSGCDRRLHIYHNRGFSSGGVIPTVGADVTLREETGSGSFGALGLPPLRGTHDVALFDIDNDGDRDMVVGLCDGTRVYLNELNEIGTAYCEANANSSAQPGRIYGTGSPAVSGGNFTLVAEQMPPNVFGFFIVSATRGFVANPGGSAGNLCLGGTLGRFVAPGQIMNSGAGGTYSLSVDLANIPAGGVTVPVLPGDTYHFTTWFRDLVL